MAAYLFTLAFSKWPAVAKWLVPVFHIACWGIPIAVTVSLGASGLLGELVACYVFLERERGRGFSSYYISLTSLAYLQHAYTQTVQPFFNPYV